MGQQNFSNKDVFARQHLSYNLHNVSTTTSKDSYFQARDKIKHMGFPQEPKQFGLYKRAYYLLLEAFESKNLDAEKYMLLFTNRLNEFFEEYPKESSLVERTRLAIIWMYYIKEQDLTKKLRDYFEDYFSNLKK